jgi:hypothetical protein
MLVKSTNMGELLRKKWLTSVVEKVRFAKCNSHYVIRKSYLYYIPYFFASLIALILSKCDWIVGR